jgi:putative mRNA 3-end processing factor
MFKKDLICFTSKGIYCPIGDFYIDPTQAVNLAIITHAHSDHTKRGCKKYVGSELTIALMKHRLGKNINTTSLKFNAEITINGVKVSLHPSGHIVGASQVRIEFKGEVAVVAGDYKTEDDGISGKFEPLKCNTFVTESTFGLPTYKWEPQQKTFDEINLWWKENKEKDLNSVIFCYTLGKAQRILKNVDHSLGKIICHYETEATNRLIRSFEINLPESNLLTEVDKNDLKGCLILAPSSAKKTTWLQNFSPYELAQASGWMQSNMFWRNFSDKGFALSDHADWNGLNWAVKETQAERVYVTHGFEAQFAKHLRSLGIDARVAKDYWDVIELGE